MKLASHNHAWSTITGKPTSFTPSSHTHDDRYYTETEINSKINDLNNKINLRGSYTTATGVYTSAEWAQGSNTCIWKAPANGVYIIFMNYELTSGEENEYRQYQIQGTATILLGYVFAYQPNGTSSLLSGSFCTLVKANSGQTVIPYVHQPTTGQKYNVKIVGVRIS